MIKRASKLVARSGHICEYNIDLYIIFNWLYSLQLSKELLFMFVFRIQTFLATGCLFKVFLWAMANFDLGRPQKSLWGCNCEENFHTFTKRIIFHCFPTFYKFRWQCDKYKENLIIKCTFFFFRFVIKCLIPHCERQLRLLHEIVSNRKTRSLFSGAKRWFGQPKPGANSSQSKKSLNDWIFYCTFIMTSVVVYQYLIYKIM